MKKKLLLSFLVFGSFIYAQNYTFTTTTETYADLVGTTSINNGVVWDEDEFLITLPYAINVNGVSTNSLIIYDSYIYNNTTSDIKQIITPYGTDFADRGLNSGASQSPISYKIDGTVGNRIAKIEYKNCGSYYDMSLSMFVNFQIWLYETTNVIEYRYGQSSITDSFMFYGGESGGIIGITSVDYNTDDLSNTHLLSGSTSNPNIATANMITFINGTPAPNTVYRFTPTGTLSTNTFEKDFVTLYPNPVKEVLNFNSKEKLEIQSVEIYNMLGQVVMVVPNTTTSIDVSSLTKGNYFVKVNTERVVQILSL
ncbi:MAG: T9SS type A sorting domain-containing protein [Flavobacterium sp.]|nr:T9SS type A sorting domain-containing protein [Flavobacterium sp.]